MLRPPKKQLARFRSGPRLVVAVVLGVAGGVRAEAPRDVTLGDVLAALPKAPLRQVAQLQTAAARSAVDAAGGWSATSIGLSTNLRTARFAPSLSVPLLVFGTLEADRALARAELSAAHERESSTEVDLRRDAQDAFVELALAQDVAALTAEAARREEELSALSEKRFAAGDAPRAEVVAANAESRRARADAAAATAAIEQRSAHLAALLGWQPTMELRAQGGIPETLAPAPLSQWLTLCDVHPSVRAAQAEVARSRAAVQQRESERWPKLNAELEASIDDPTLPGSDLRVGLGLELPMFAHAGDLEEAARATERAAQAQEDATRRMQRAQVVATHRKLIAVLEQLRVLGEEILPAQREAAALARTAYKEGQQGLFAVLAADRLLSDAELGLLEAKAAAALARDELEWSAGATR